MYVSKREHSCHKSEIIPTIKYMKYGLVGKKREE
jgi:hypothetical protein